MNKYEWKSVEGGRSLAGIIGSRGFKTGQKLTINALVTMARTLFGLPMTITTPKQAVKAIKEMPRSELKKIPHLEKHLRSYHLRKSAKKRNKSVSIASIEAQPSQNKIKEFYSSWEWSRVRYDYLIDKDRKCQCCNASAADGIRIIVDHIKPIRKHWSLRLRKDNLQILCDACNKGKGSRDETDWFSKNEDMLNIKLE